MKERLFQLKSNKKSKHTLTAISLLGLTVLLGYTQLSVAQQPVGQKDAHPIYRVEPLYPVQAVAKNIEGYVNLSFSIETDGSVSDVKVEQSEPNKTFNRSAINALAQWQYSKPTHKLTNQKVQLNYILGAKDEASANKDHRESIDVQGAK